MVDIDKLSEVMDKIHESNKEKRLIGIKVKPFVLDALKRKNIQQYREDFSIVDKLMGLDIYVDEDAEYPFTPVYNHQ